MKKASDLFIECLLEEGVEYIFGMPGEENLDLLESIRKSNIRFILTRHEQAAAFMAATYGRLTGKAGVVLSTLGPGATNLVTGIAFAQLGGMPLVAITGQKPIKKSKQGQFQIIDVVGMMKSITKMTECIMSAERIPSLVRQAFKLAEDERPGAVHLELPEDIAVEYSDRSSFHRIKVRRAGPDPKAIEMAVRFIEGAQRPLLLIAGGANRTLIRDNLESFIEKTHIPFVTTQMGKGVIDERSPYYLGTTALSEHDIVHCAIDQSDLVISIGHDVVEKPPALFSSQERKVLHINFYPAIIDDVYVPSHEVVGDISHTLWLLTELIKPQTHWDFSFTQNIGAKIRELFEGGIHFSHFPLKPQRFVADLRAVLPTHSTISLDNGMYKLWIARHYQAYEQNTVLLDNALATMGAGLPNAIAAKLVDPSRTVVAICGDGGFMMNSQELETATRLGIDLVVIVVRDDGLGMIKWKQDSSGFGAFGLDFKNPDFVAYAESYGAHGFRISSADEFQSILKDCIGKKGVYLIDCPIDYSENVKVFTEEIARQTCDL